MGHCSAQLPVLGDISDAPLCQKKLCAVYQTSHDLWLRSYEKGQAPPPLSSCGLNHLHWRGLRRKLCLNHFNQCGSDFRRCGLLRVDSETCLLRSTVDLCGHVLSNFSGCNVTHESVFVNPTKRFLFFVGGWATVFREGCRRHRWLTEFNKCSSKKLAAKWRL